MKQETLLRALTDVDDSLIEDASPDCAKKHKRPPWVRLVALAASVVIVVTASIGIGLFDWDNNTAAPESDGEKSESGSLFADDAADVSETVWSQQYVDIGSLVGGDKEGLVYVKRWEEKNLSERFPETTIQGAVYSMRDTTVDASRIGDVVGMAELTGSDIYTDTAYTAKATAYEIQGIAAKCAVALQFEGDTVYYAYNNRSYMPATLGDFVQDVGLKENLTCNIVYYDNSKATEPGVTRTVELTGLEMQTVWDMLLTDMSLQTQQMDCMWESVGRMSLSVSMPLLGYENVSLTVNREGFVLTNLLDTGKGYFVGEERAQQFRQYVLDHCDGVEKIYDYASYYNDTSSSDGTSETVTQTTVSRASQP